jgi:hypothetical protein
MPYDETTDAGNVSFTLLWDEDTADLNAHLSYPDNVSAADLNAGTPAVYYVANTVGPIRTRRYGDMD